MDVGLVYKDSIFIYGDEGRNEIQLYFGDITKLPKKDEVDVLLISAYPGSYPERGATVMAALKRNFDLSLRELAADKAEDLRKDFSCWISKPLPQHLPYRRLLCFEQSRSVANFANRLRNPDQQLSDVFRAFTTLFSNNDSISVVSPLLGTGGQGHDWGKMLSAMVKTCAAWMRAGMPLKIMKVVVYVPVKKLMKHPANLALLTLFAQLKSSLETLVETKKTITRKHDAMMIYSSIDTKAVQVYISHLKSNYSKVKLLLEEIEWLKDEDEEEEESNDFEQWSKQTEKKMVLAKKVVCFLSPSFLSSKECVDSYNLAMCLSRKWQNSLLAPVYLETMPYVPAYLSLTQWIDCRRKDSDSADHDRMKLGANHLRDLLSTISFELKMPTSRSGQFDVFISYCHKDSERVKQFVDALSRSSSKLRIFIDKEELKTGYAWQATLYSALSSSSLVVAFVSPYYVKSKMCYEEFAIASSQHVSREYDSRLVAVHLESLGDAKMDPMFSSCPCISTEDGDKKATELLTKFVQSHRYNLPSNACHMDQTLRDARNSFMKSFWVFNGDTQKMDFKGSSLETAAGISRRVVLCCHPEEAEQATIVRNLLRRLTADNSGDDTAEEKSSTKANDSNFVVDIVSQDYPAAHSLIESADLVLLMLSALFCTQPSTVALLNVAMALGRSDKCRLLAVIISSLPRRPSVLHLLPTPINLKDSFWLFEEQISMRGGYPLEISESETWSIDFKFSISYQLALRATVEWMIHCLTTQSHDDNCTVTYLGNIKEKCYSTKVSPVAFDSKLLITDINDILSEPVSETVPDNASIDEALNDRQQSSPDTAVEETASQGLKYEKVIGVPDPPPKKRSSACQLL